MWEKKCNFVDLIAFHSLFSTIPFHVFCLFKSLWWVANNMAKSIRSTARVIGRSNLKGLFFSSIKISNQRLHVRKRWALVVRWANESIWPITNRLDYSPSYDIWVMKTSILAHYKIWIVSDLLPHLVHLWNLNPPIAESKSRTLIGHHANLVSKHPTFLALEWFLEMNLFSALKIKNTTPKMALLYYDLLWAKRCTDLQNSLASDFRAHREIFKPMNLEM